MEGNAEKSCSHSKGMREADLWGKILKDQNTHSLAQQPGWRMGAHLSQPGNIRGESTLRSTERRGKNTGSFILGRTHRHPVTCQLTQGTLRISIFEFLQFCGTFNHSSLERVTNTAPPLPWSPWRFTKNSYPSFSFFFSNCVRSIYGHQRELGKYKVYEEAEVNTHNNTGMFPSRFCFFKFCFFKVLHI